MHGRIYYDTYDRLHLIIIISLRSRACDRDSQTGGDRIKTALHLQQCTYKNNVHFLFDKLSR